MAKKSLLATAVVFLMILITVFSWADVPGLINYQGKLTDSDGNPLTGTYEMNFLIYTTLTGDTAEWSETQDVTVTDGIYNVELGDGIPLPAALFAGNDELYLEVQVKEPPATTWDTLEPRQRLTSTAFAMKAAVADEVMEGAVTTVMIADSAVDTQKVADSAITSGKVASNAITSAKIADGTVTAVDIADGSGSGLDADKLDGKEASDFITAVNAGDGLVGGGSSGDVYLAVELPLSLSGSSYGGVISGINSSTLEGVGGVYGESTATSGEHYGVYGKSASQDGYGVFGYSAGTIGTGVYGFSDYGYGVEGKAFPVGVRGVATGDYYENFGVIGESISTSGIGVKGMAKAWSGTTYGVYGLSDSTSGDGVRGWATAGSGSTRGISGRSSSPQGYGVYGRAAANSGTTYGVYGLSDSDSGIGVKGEAPSIGVKGVHTGTGNYADLGVSNAGMRAIAFSGGGDGIRASSSDSGKAGVYAYSTASDGRGVYGYASASSGSRHGVRGEVNGTGYGLYTPDNLYVGGTCDGCTSAFIAQNASEQPLKVGDVVAVSGVGPILKGHSQPILEVRHAATSDPSVLGVVHSRGEFYGPNEEQEEDDDSVQHVGGDAEPGDYLFVVTSGLAKVRVASNLKRINPGESLSAGEVSGVAKLAEAGSRPEVVFARAMEAEPDENGLIWALVNTR